MQLFLNNIYIPIGEDDIATKFTQRINHIML